MEILSLRLNTALIIVITSESCLCIMVFKVKTMLPPTRVNIHSRANQSTPADCSPCQPGPLTAEGHIVPIV